MALAVERSGRPARRFDGWLGFLAWTAAGMLSTLTVVGMASIGVLVLPFAIVGVLLAARYGQSGSQLLGLLAGAAATSILVGFLNLDFAGPCPQSPNRSFNVGESCGGLNPVPWFLVGGALLSLATGGFAFARRR